MTYEGLASLLASQQARADDNYGRMMRTVGADYDYSKAPQGPNNFDHYGDEGKLPSHITFSTHSAYSTPENPGGTWSEVDNKWAYTPHPTQFLNKDGSTNQEYVSGLANYFKNERGRGIDMISLPAPYAMPSKLVDVQK